MNEEYKEYDMKWLTKFLGVFFAPLKEELRTEMEQEIERIQKDYQGKIDILNVRIGNLSREIESSKKTANDVVQLTKDVQPLLDAYNKEKSSAKNKYVNAIDSISDLWKTFNQRLRKFKEKKQTLENLVRFFCEPTPELRMRIPESDEDVRDLFAKIETFNKEQKSTFVEILASFYKKEWKDCIKFPPSKKFNSREMDAQGDSDIRFGADVYVVNFGYDFPDSNLGSQKPVVYPKEDISIYDNAVFSTSNMNYGNRSNTTYTNSNVGVGGGTHSSAEKPITMGRNNNNDD